MPALTFQDWLVKVTSAEGVGTGIAGGETDGCETGGCGETAVGAGKAVTASEVLARATVRRPSRRPQNRNKVLKDRRQGRARSGLVTY
eukprot:3317740-Pleurochrysis_carterae.AAC.2